MQDLNDRANPPPTYSIGVSNDDGDCYDIVLKQIDKPLATLIATEKALAPIVRAGNCFPAMLDALHDAETEIENMLEDFSEEPEEDISAHRTLTKIRAAIAAAMSGQA